MRTKHASRDPFRVFEYRHGLAQIFERGAGVIAERRRRSRPHLERESIVVTENASRLGADTRAFLDGRAYFGADGAALDRDGRAHFGADTGAFLDGRAYFGADAAALDRDRRAYGRAHGAAFHGDGSTYFGADCRAYA